MKVPFIWPPSSPLGKLASQLASQLAKSEPFLPAPKRSPKEVGAPVLPCLLAPLPPSRWGASLCSLGVFFVFNLALFAFILLLCRFCLFLLHEPACCCFSLPIALLQAASQLPASATFSLATFSLANQTGPQLFAAEQPADEEVVLWCAPSGSELAWFQPHALGTVCRWPSGANKKPAASYLHA